MSLSCYGLCYHNSNKKNFKSSFQSCQPEETMVAIMCLHTSGLSLDVLNTIASISPEFIPA